MSMEIAPVAPVSDAPSPTDARFSGTMALIMEPARYEAFKTLAVVMYAGGRGTGFIPECFKNGQEVQAAMLIALSMGRDPVQALQYAMPMPKGRVGWDYKWLMSVAEERAPRYRWGVIEQVPGKKFRGWMQASPDHPRYESEYTIEMAAKAGLVKDKSAWETQPDDMIFKSWWLRSARRCIPSATMGISPPDVGDDALNDLPESVATEPAAQATSPAPPAAPPAPASEEAGKDWHKEFLAVAKKHGWDTRSGEKMKGLLEELLTIEGVVTRYASAKEVPPGDWRLGVQKLRAKYEKDSSDATVVDEGAGTAGGTTPAPAAETESEPAPEASDDELEPTDEQAGDAAREAQLQSPEFLLSLCEELEKVWKSPLSVVKPSQKDKTKMWFTNTDMLREIGSMASDTMVQPLAFFQTTDPNKMLDAQRTYALCHAVMRRLDDHKNGGRPAIAQRS